jgi:hypothetical protein
MTTTIAILMPHPIRDALERVLAYAMPDEAENYEITPPEERDGHVYQSLRTVRQWLDAAADKNCELDIVAICNLLEGRGHIAALWSVDDVQPLRPDLTDAQCREVLQECSRHHDTGIGINGHVIEEQARDLFPPTGEWVGPFGDMS